MFGSADHSPHVRYEETAKEERTIHRFIVQADGGGGGVLPPSLIVFFFFFHLATSPLVVVVAAVSVVAVVLVVDLVMRVPTETASGPLLFPVEGELTQLAPPPSLLAATLKTWPSLYFY